MRILGACINCGELDGIWCVGEGARCNFCRKQWLDYRDPVEQALAKGRRLLAVKVKASSDQVVLEWPLLCYIPCADVVDAALKAALVEHYPTLTTEFGVNGYVRGRVGGGLVDLRSRETNLGLVSVPCAAKVHPRETKWVLEKYKILLYLLFMRRLGRGDDALRAGAILWLPRDYPDNIIEVGRTLNRALEKVGGWKFRERIMSGLYSKGLIQKWHRPSRSPSLGRQTV